MAKNTPRPTVAPEIETPVVETSAVGGMELDMTEAPPAVAPVVIVAPEPPPAPAPEVPEPAPVVEPVAVVGMPAKPEPIAGLSVGRIVGFVLPASHARVGQVVPAVITRMWGAGHPTVQLTPFVDVANDGAVAPSECSSVCHDAEGKEPRTWHWLPRV